MLIWHGEIKTLMDQNALACGLLFALLDDFWDAWCFGGLSDIILLHKVPWQKKVHKPDSMETKTDTVTTSPFALFYLIKYLPTIVCVIVA